ncbi:MAG: PKD domain-containing protein [Lacisediminihabitans sp.]
MPRFFAVALALAIAVALALVFISAPPPARADTAPVDPANPATPPTVSADALPTVQMDGVAWAQVVVGNTVYVAGKFTTARPAGVAVGGPGTVTRNNLLAYNITTGNLITSFAPSLNAQALGITASPDGSRIYVVGDFTAVDGAGYYRIAAFSTATGQIIPSFRPILESQGRAVVATNSTVYMGGTFSSVNGTPRGYVAQVNAADGSVTSWNPQADSTVEALALTPDGTRLILGGRFANLGGQPNYGLGAVDTATGNVVPWAANQKVRDAGVKASITSLYATNDRVYGSGYVFGSNSDGNLEGIFSADPDTGNLYWIEDCHGDTYSVYALGDAVYGAGHPHYCGNIGGYPQTNPWTYHHTVAFSKAATGTITPDPYGYFNWAGNPSPSLLNWFPQYVTGSFTGQGQAAWSLAGNSQYVVVGGEFPFVNGVAQYGLTRFAVASIAPNAVGPNVNTALVPSAASYNKGEVRVSWTATYDQDNTNLSYKVVRDGVTASPVYETTQQSTFWQRAPMGFIDKNLTPGSTHSYRVYVTDPFGNSISRLGSPVTVASTDSGGAYSDAVTTDAPASYWPLNESSGSSSFDHVGFTDLQFGAGVTRGATGPLTGVPASSFNGTANGFGSTQSAVAGPDTFTAESWVRTTSTQGGKILGFGNSTTGTSTSYDRHVYMDNSGHVWFGVYPGSAQTVNTIASYNDGQWHHIVASLGSNGMRLYVDGKVVGSRDDVTSGQSYTGYWRVGGDSLNGWPSQPSSNFLNGDIAQVAVYPTVLTKTQVINHYVASGRVSPVPPAPADAYGAAVYNNDPLLYWRLADTAGTAAVDSGQQDNPGTFSGGNPTKGVSGALSGNSNAAVTFKAQAIVASNTQFTNPTTYSLETWFQTTTGSGGKLIGFGNQQSGLSSNYDRHIYMQDDGRLVFGVWTGQTNTITTVNSYSDGLWHYVVASQSSDGMKLYVDGTLAGTNPQTGSQSYSGYWRIGGDQTWGSTSPYFNGKLDEVAVYNTALSAADISNHYAIGTGTVVNQPPTALFTSTMSNLNASFDATTSSDPDGSIASYSWDFGDGQIGSGSTATHSYALAGPYTVTLTVTDNQGASSTVSHTVTAVAPNVPPTAAFTTTVTNLNGAFNAATSSDPDGTVASYAWDFGDGQTGTGVSPTHGYATAGSYNVLLTVTDDRGGTNSVSHAVAPTAAPVVPTPDHTVVVVMENHSSSQVIGNASAPYINSLATGGALMTQSFAVAHPSQPNYLALFSGSTNGVTDDGCPFSFTTTNLADQLAAAGKSFIGYSESMPSVGYTGCSSGNYARKHNPWVNWPSVPAAANQPFTAFPTDYSTLPAVSFVIPNLQNDMHDGTIAQADTWLQNNLGAYASWAVQHNSLLLLTWDEDDNNAGNQIPTILVGERVHTGSYAETINHYDVLRTIQDAYGLPSNDLSAAARPITDIWGSANVPPTAAFTSAVNNLDATFNASTSSDPDGTVSSYAWDFGDGTSGSGVTTSHSYAVAGSYTVSLVVTDNHGAVSTATTHSVTATAPGSASVLAQDAFARSVTAGWGSADIGGPWTITGNTANLSVSAGFGLMNLGAGSTRTARLNAVSSSDVDLQATMSLSAMPTGGGSFTDFIGRQVGTSQYIAEVWVKPTGAVFVVLEQGSTVLTAVAVPGLTYTAGTQLQVRVRVTGTSPTTLQAKVWPTGQAEPSTWAATRTDTTAALQTAGSLGVQGYLSSSATSPVTTSFDNLSATTSVAPPPNQTPVAAFTSATSGLGVTVNGSTSSDPDGTVTAYSWTFGDGQNGTGVTASHSYAAAGTYSIGLTVTDNSGAASAVVTHAVTVTAPPANVLAQDAFGRTVSSGWGSADVGGAWTNAGAASAYAVSAGTGQQTAPAGSTKTSSLSSFSASATDLLVGFTTDQAPSGGGVFVSVIGRDVGTSNYQARVWMQASGVVQLQLLQGGTALQLVNITGLTYTAGSVLQVRLQVFGTSPTTVRAKVWASGQTEPSAWQASATDNTAALQTVGSIGLRSYLSATATTVPLTTRFSGLLVSPPQ